MPEVFVQICAAHSRDTRKDEEYRADQIDEITQTTQVMGTGQEVLDALPNAQAMSLREQDVTPVGAKHTQCAERPTALLFEIRWDIQRPQAGGENILQIDAP